jgi:hypothetical protein
MMTALADIQKEEDERIFWALRLVTCPPGCLVVRFDIELF